MTTFSLRDTMISTYQGRDLLYSLGTVRCFSSSQWPSPGRSWTAQSRAKCESTGRRICVRGHTRWSFARCERGRRVGTAKPFVFRVGSLIATEWLLTVCRIGRTATFDPWTVNCPIPTTRSLSRTSSSRLFGHSQSPRTTMVPS